MSETERKNGFFVTVVKGVGLAVIVTLIGVLIFAIVVKAATLNSGVIKAVNQFIKILSIFLGCFFFIRERAGLIKGGLVGVFATVITYLIFSLIGGELSFGLSFLLDLAFSLIVGAISGVIAVNTKKD